MEGRLLESSDKIEETTSEDTHGAAWRKMGGYRGGVDWNNQPANRRSLILPAIAGTTNQNRFART